MAELTHIEHPRIKTAIDRYRQMIQGSPEKVIPCELAIELKAPDEIRRPMLRELLKIERQHAQELGVSISFETYFERPWFDNKGIDDLVWVILEPEYLVEERLGSGGQGRVYRVRNRAVHDRKEALKIFLPTDPAYLREYEPDEYSRLQKRFALESESLAKLSIDHLPTVYDVRVLHGLQFFTMEFIVGSSLIKTLDKGLVESRQAVMWMITIADTLTQLHAKKIIHRDLKPSNLIVNNKGKLFVVDFGLIKLMPGAMSGTILKHGGKLTGSHGYGSRGYVSPEQSIDASRVTTKTDIYSLGATLFQLLNGFIYPGPDQDHPGWMPHVPKDLRELCLRYLNQDPDQRPTAEEVANDLRAWLQKSHRLEAIANRPSRRGLFLGVGAVVVITGITVWLLTRKK
jgi:serine/threonine protein kinase